MTETVDGGDDLARPRTTVRHGRPRAAGRRDQDRRGRRDPASRARTSSAATTRTTTRRSARSSTAGCTPATSGALDEDGYLSITGRKKDIIITAGGKNLTPANLENDMKQSRWVSQAVMHGDRRPFPVDARSRSTRRRSCPGPRQQGIEDTLDRRAGRATEQVRALIQERARRGQREVRAGRAGQEVLDPRPRPLAGDRRADADAEGQAQRRQREVRRAASTRSTAEPPGAGAPLPSDGCGPIPPTTAASSSAAGPARRRSRTASCPSRAAARRRRVDGVLARLRPGAAWCSSTSSSGARSPPARCGSPRRCEYRTGSVMLRHRRRLRGAARRAVRRRSRCSSASTSAWILIRRAAGTTSARASSAASSPSTAAIGVVALHGLAAGHRRARARRSRRPAADARGPRATTGSSRSCPRRRSARSCARRPTSAARKALARVEPLDLARTTWPEYPPPRDRQRDHLRRAPRAAPLPRPRHAPSCAPSWPTATASPEERLVVGDGAVAAAVGAPPRRCSSPATSSSRRGRPTRCIRVMARRARGARGAGRRASAPTPMLAAVNDAHAASSRCATRTTRRASCWASTSSRALLDRAARARRRAARRGAARLRRRRAARRDARAARGPPAAAGLPHVLQGLGAGRACAAATPSAARAPSRCSSSSRPSSALNELAQAGALEALRTRRPRSRAPRGAHDRRAARAPGRRRCASAGFDVAASQANVAVGARARAARRRRARRTAWSAPGSSWPPAAAGGAGPRAHHGPAPARAHRSRCLRALDPGRLEAPAPGSLPA